MVAAAGTATAAIAADLVLDRNADGVATLGGRPLARWLEEAGVATPAYVYDLDAIAAEAADLAAGFGAQAHLIAFAVKANSAGPIVRRLAKLGVGADVVSGAELELALLCGVPPDRIVYSGVAKTDSELDRAIGAGILALSVESVEELPRVAARANALGKRASVALRINPGIEADTHAYIATGHDEAKFGIPKGAVGDAIETLLAHDALQLVGVGQHIGSQLTATAEYIAAARMLLPIFAACDTAMTQRGRPALETIDFGGGFGIDYGGGCAVRPRDFATLATAELSRAGLTRVKLLVEPGRSLVGSHGVLVATTIMSKRAGERRWLMIDAGMNDLLRPALYQAKHRIEPLVLGPALDASYRVVGPVCESSDDFGAHVLPVPPPDGVLIRDAGAYGFTMASEYNGRALPSEIFVSGGGVECVLRARSASDWARSRLG